MYLANKRMQNVGPSLHPPDEGADGAVASANGVYPLFPVSKPKVRGMNRFISR